MTDAAISVAITGKDTLSPALDAVQTRLERSRIALNASGAVAEQFRTKLAALQGQYATGEISAIEYDRALAKLERQFRNTSEAVTAFKTQTAAGAGVTNQFVTNADRAAHGATKLAFGIQTASLAMQGGRISAQGLISSLGMMGIGSPWFLAITAGLTVVSNLILQMDERSAAAADEIERSTERIRGSIGGMDNRARLQGIVQQLEAKERMSVEIDSHGRPVFHGGLSPEESATLNSARARLAELRRSGRRPDGKGEDIFNHGTAKNDKRMPGSEDLDIPNLSAAIKGALGHFDKSDTALIRDELKRLKDDLKSTGQAALNMGTAFTTGWGAVIDAASSGGNVLKALTNAVLGEISREARTKALFEAAEGFAALFNPAKGGPAGAAAHFKSAALYSAVAVGAGVAGSGGGGGGGGASRGGATGTGTRHADYGTTPGNNPVTIQEFYIAGQGTRQLVASIRREGNLGGIRPEPVAIDLPGTLVVARG